MPIGIGDIIKAAQLVYDQVEKAKFNREQARLFARDIRAVVDSIERAGKNQDFESKFESPLEDLQAWLLKAKNLVEKFSGGIGSKISNFLQAGGYKERFAVLSEELVKIAGTFNLELGIQSWQDSTEARKAQQIDIQQLLKAMQELKDVVAEGMKKDQKLSPPVKMTQSVGPKAKLKKGAQQSAFGKKGVGQDPAGYKAAQEHIEQLTKFLSNRLLEISQNVGDEAIVDDELTQSFGEVVHGPEPDSQSLPSTASAGASSLLRKENRQGEEKSMDLAFSIKRRGKIIKLKFKRESEKKEMWRSLKVLQPFSLGRTPTLVMVD